MRCVLGLGAANGGIPRGHLMVNSLHLSKLFTVF